MSRASFESELSELFTELLAGSSPTKAPCLSFTAKPRAVKSAHV